MALAEVLRRHEVRHQRLLGRALEGARHAEDGQDDEDRAPTAWMPAAVKASSADGADGLAGEADRHDERGGCSGRRLRR